VDINTAPNWFVLLAFLAFAAAVFAWFWLAVRAARDIDGRGGPGWIVGILIIFMPPIGLLAWLILRERGSWTGSI
jgi:hypothetical protein